MATRNIAFIGSGNVAWHLAPALENVGYPVVEVYSRNPTNARQLTERLYKATIKADLNFADSAAEIFIISVSDSALEEIAAELIIPEEAHVVHTSGSQSLSKLGYVPTDNIGVFYPLQTFTKGHPVDLEQVPICIEADNKYTKQILFEMAMQLSTKVVEVSSADRVGLHVAAVFACNFTNHLMAVAEKLLKDRNIEPEILYPLIVETINKSLSIGASQAQTGPAKRGDMEILDKHMAYLQHQPDWQELYKQLSQNIIDTYGR